MKPTVQINMRLDLEFYERLEEARGSTPRTTFIRECLEEKMESATSMQKKPASSDRVQKPDLPVTPEISGVKKAAEVKYRCRVSGCDFTAPSPAANCPSHTGKLVLA
jgi:predicted DNA-binding protein